MNTLYRAKCGCAAVVEWWGGVFQRFSAESVLVPGHWSGKHRHDHAVHAARFFQGLWLGLGTCVGDLAYAILAMLGMAVLLQYEAVRYVLWIGGTAVLAWFCFRMIMSATTVSNGLDSQAV